MSFKKAAALFLAAASFGAVAAAPVLTLNIVPSVSILSPEKTLYEKRINANGTIETKSTKEIYLETPVIAQNVSVSVGDYVHEGDVLATIDTELTRSVLKQSTPASMLFGDAFSMQDSVELSGLYTALQAAGLGSGLDDSLEALAQDYESLKDKLPNENSYIYIPERITAPMNGIVTQVDLQSDILSRTANPLITISDTNSFVAMMTVNESNIGEIHVGDAALITGTGFSGREYNGHVSKIYPTARKTSASTAAETVVDIEITIDNPDKALKAGFTARAEIITDQRRDMLTVPYEAISQDENNQEFVYVIEQAKPVRRDIKTGQELLDGVEVTEGLTEQDLVVTDAAAVQKSSGMPMRLKWSEYHAD